MSGTGHDGPDDGGPGASRDPGAGSRARYRTFRSRYTTPVAWALGLALGAGCLVVAMVATGPGAENPVSRVSIILTGVLLAWLTIRFGAVRAVPDPDGLTVVNYLRRRRLDWAEILGVRFTSGDPWVHLDLADGTVLAVMAVQRSDGEHAMAEARRLASLVSERGEADEPPGGLAPRGG